ncbi:uncharacterized protein ACR2FA_002856 [Aphomia sociella]
MRSLVVLCALASLAIAAPSLTKEGYKNVLPNNWPEFTKREKKSPQFFAEPLSLNNEAQPLHLTSEFDEDITSGRSFGFKKPIIIKKTGGHGGHGYHVYRDSEEERAQSDPQESCSKQVNFKLCERNDIEKGRSHIERSAKEEINIHDDNMEHSIQMAKEAIENLQRDLKNIENSPGSKMPMQREVTHTEFRDDIEVARQALDHIHRNFGNLESMDLKATTLRDTDNLHEPNNHAKLVQEKMAQWKDHTHKNIDIGRNMEDRFVSPHRESKLLQFENNSNIKKGDQVQVDTIEVNEKDLNERHSNTEDKNLDLTKHKMKTSETEIREHKMEMPEKNHEEIKLPNTKSDDMSFNVQSNIMEMKTPIKTEQPGINKTQERDTDILMKAAKHEDEKHNENQLESNQHNIASLNKMKASEISNLEKIVTNLDKSENKEWNQNTKQEKSAWQDMKAAENSEHNVLLRNNQVEHTKTDFSQVAKSTEHDIIARKPTEMHTMKHDMLKSADVTGLDTNSPMASWVHRKNENKEDIHESHDHHQMKAAGELHKGNMNTHMHGDHHHHHHFIRFHHSPHPMNEFNHKHVGSDMEFNSHQGQLKNPSMKPLMNHAKSADMDNFMQPTNQQMNMGDFTGKSALENMLQWSHKQDGGRSAYGPSYGGSGGLNPAVPAGSGAVSSGAVGVFPNANVGGCAIPLLLSCSPSVVPGHLAKSGYGHDSGYGGSVPAYRANEEHNIHMKRDIKKTNDNTINKIKRSSKALKKIDTISNDKKL